MSNDPQARTPDGFSLGDMVKDSVTAPQDHGMAPGSKKIVVCLDGTGNQIGGSRLPTNVGKIYQMLDLQLPDKQIAYYDPGVGTLPASTVHGRVARQWSHLTQMAFGLGMRANLTQAYTWLMQHYQPNDKIYVFGFSRGAYTARALAGMLIRPGLLRPGSENLIDYAMAEYAANRKRARPVQAGIVDFADSFCWGTKDDPMSPGWEEVTAKHPEDPLNLHSVPISYLGLWDTVKAAGVPGFVGDLRWAFTNELWNADYIRHAVSIDERRRPFKYEPVQIRENVEEVWFAGVHSDVGGTFTDDRLATIALKWIVDGACQDLILRGNLYSRRFTPNLLDACGEINPMKPLWRVIGSRPRVYSDTARFHDSVRERRKTKRFSDYLPKLTIPDDSDRWANRNWKAPAWP